MISVKNRIRTEVLTILDLPGNEVKRMRTIIRSQPDLFDKYGTYLDVFITDLRKKSFKTSHQTESDLNTLLYVRLAEILAIGISKGFFRRMDPLIAARALVSTIESLASDMIERFDKEEIKEKFNQVEQLFVDGMLSIPEP
jgi:hypothetical protein